MTILNIVRWPNKILKTQAEIVTEFDDDLKQFVNDMHETMEASNGIGLAANQVGDLRRVIVIKLNEPPEGEEKKPWYGVPYTLINPFIVGKSGKLKQVEGCLSFPGAYESVERADTIIVQCQDITGAVQEINAEGLFSVCLQHEIDHLNGIIFTDRMSRLKASIVHRKTKRY